MRQVLRVLRKVNNRSETGIGAIALLMTLAGLPAGVQAADSWHDYPQRFSMAISGGASKGAYEAGLNWAILAVGKASSDVDPVIGGRVRPFEAASFAGASAGSINSLLSGLSWCLRPEPDGGPADAIGDNFFRTVWLKPDVNRLLPELPDSDIYLIDDALLSRRDLLDAARELQEKWQRPVFIPGCRVPLGVTVTRVEPAQLRIGDVRVQNQRFYIPFELRVDDSGRVGFAFNPDDYPRLDDPAMILLPTRAGEPAFSITDEQVETAVFTSAAFPLAFGRKQLHYCRLASIAAETKSTDEGDRSDGDDDAYSCPEGYELAKAVFADGGLFDNLPIGVARLLAEFGNTTNPLPVTYVYLDPNRLRFSVPRRKREVCAGAQPHPACEVMEFGFASESELLLGALGTARSYELYRELTSPAWQFNLSELAYRLANRLEESAGAQTCDEELAFFEAPADCAQAVRDTGRLLELSYDLTRVPVTEPFSVDRLSAAGIVSDCQSPQAADAAFDECRVDISRLRAQLLSAVDAIAVRSDLADEDLDQQLRLSATSLRGDRIIRVTSVGSPITGTLLASFAAFLDLKFREYDYYVGVYDAVVAAVDVRCNLQYSYSVDAGRFRECREQLAKFMYQRLIEQDARGRYVFALLARAEFEHEDALAFAYSPMPAQDDDMRIINEALGKALAAGTLSKEARDTPFFVEREFFDHLRDENFEPTPTGTGRPSLLTPIIDDPDRWSHEIVNRVTNRLMLLEQDAQQIIADRDPQLSYGDQKATSMAGSAYFILRTAAYKYRGFEFAPSTAPPEWLWRNLIPYEVGFEASEGDITATWQPTYAATPTDLLGVRATIGFAGGIFDSAADRENYLSLGIDYTRLTPFTFATSFGVTPVYFHYLDERDSVDRNTWGADVHLGVLENRLRFGLGVRDLDDPEDSIMFTVGITDLPGLVYWTTR